MRLWIVQEIDDNVSRKRRLVYIVRQRRFWLKMRMRCPMGERGEDQKNRSQTRWRGDSLSESSESVTRTQQHEPHPPTEDIAPRY